MNGYARNVILMIGDGMGPAHRQAARWSLGKRALHMDELPVSGLMHTSCADPDALVTDSAAAATALATGTKTRNGMVGMNPAGVASRSILELAQRAGKATGLVTTCQVTDATPAAFGAHVPDRADQAEIARQYIEETSVDVILGGGADWWRPLGSIRRFPSHPLDDPAAAGLGRHGDLLARARAAGYHTPAAASDLRRGERKTLGLFANQEFFRQSPEGQGDHYDPPISLDDLTGIALDLLAVSDDGFFLMIEEAAIDRMGHHNNGRLAIRGVHELDRAVARARRFAEADGETLLIVTADHETGGLSCDEHEHERPHEFALQPRLRWQTTGHTDTSVPLNAMGPGAEALSGSIENTDVFQAMAQAMGLAVEVMSGSRD